MNRLHVVTSWLPAFRLNTQLSIRLHVVTSWLPAFRLNTQLSIL